VFLSGVGLFVFLLFGVGLFVSLRRWSVFVFLSGVGLFVFFFWRWFVRVFLFGVLGLGLDFDARGSLATASNLPFSLEVLSFWVARG